MPTTQAIEGGINALVSPRFTQVWFIDTEFQAADGERNVPVSLCAYELRSKVKVEMFFDRAHENIFADANALFICYNAVAEWKTLLALGWEVPSNTIDLYVEYLNTVNGVWRGNTSLRELGTGLVDAMREHGLDPMDAAEKDAERQYIIANGTKAPVGVSDENHARRIIDYCWTDVRGTFQLAKRMLPGLDFEQALWRGAYTRPAAHYEHNGLPVNVGRYGQINARRSELQIEIAEKIEAKNGYGVYAIEGTKKNPRQKAVFKMKRFEALLDRMGILEAWPKTDTGQPMTDDEEVFQPMAKLYPALEDLRQARKSLNDLGRFGSHVGRDGFNRAPLWPFGTITSRNNPKAKAFLLSRPHWVRNLITPREGMAIVHGDIVGAEAWLAAGFSGDPELMRIYQSGADQYLEFAVVTGAVPLGTVRDKSDKGLERVRDIHKTALLAINYGVKENTLGTYLGVPPWKAGYIINSHKEAYGVYWAWAIGQVEKAKSSGYVGTDFGWRLDAEHAPFNTLLNFPQQAACGEVLRAASVFLCDRGWGPCLAAPHHDAVYMHVPAEHAERAKNDLEECFVEAGNVVMGDPNFLLRVDASIELYPDHYVDPDGAAIWQVVSDFFGWEGGRASESEYLMKEEAAA